jgi:hypothetical protein
MERPRITPLHSVSQHVCEAVAAYSNTPVLELPSLYDSIDPDALDAVVRTVEHGRVEFRYAERDVTVHSDGTVDVSKRSTHGSKHREPAADD